MSSSPSTTRRARPRPWSRLLRRPASRAGSAALTAVVFAGVLAATVGTGYSVTHTFLADGAAYLTKGHTVAHVNGDSGASDAQLAQDLAKGKEQLAAVRLPDGRLAIVNNRTGVVKFFDVSTLTGKGPDRTGTPGKVAAIPTRSHAYIVDRGSNRVVNVALGQPASQVDIPEGIAAAVPAGDSLWVVTEHNEVVEVSDGKRGQPIRLGSRRLGITVADDHPMVVDTAGTASVVDGDEPRKIGDTGLHGDGVVLGSWQGAGRYALAVDQGGKFVALDPRTGQKKIVDLPNPKGKAQFGAPVVLDQRAYVPDYAAMVVWKVELTTGQVASKSFDVPHAAGQTGHFDLFVSGGRVWANSQYDQRALVIDDSGAVRPADKGAGAGTTDSQGGASQPTPDNPPPTDSAPPPDTAASDQPPKMVPVPSFPPGTRYQDACAELKRAELDCDPVPVGDRTGRKADEVISTDPKAGVPTQANTKVVVSYVGPVKVPSVLRDHYLHACAVIKAAGLSCVPRVSPAVAATPEQLGIVSQQDPPAGEKIDKGKAVTITYSSPDTVALRSFIGMSRPAACQEIITRYRMTCQEVEGKPALGAGEVAGAVYDQTPKPPASAKIGTQVTITYYSGTVLVGNYVNLVPPDWQTACARVRADGLTCNPVAGRTAAGTGQPPGTVYAQDPPPGTKLQIGRDNLTVTITYYSDQNQLPGYGGQDFGAACADVNARGFQCNPVQELRLITDAGQVNHVLAQDQPPGTYQLGTTVTIRYTSWAAVRYVIYRKNDEPVWALRVEGDVPTGYGNAPASAGPSMYPVGWAYQDGIGIPGAQHVHGFYCLPPNNQCEGLSTNHFYSLRSSSYSNWEGPTSAAEFMTCDGQHGKPIYRVFKDVGGKRLYGITDSPGGYDYNELLGCVWP